MESEQIGSYVLVTPAFNEARNIEKTLESVISQVVLPRKWVIVSDGSTDGTDRIAFKYAAKWPFIELRRLEKQRRADFASKVRAFNEGVKALGRTDFEFIGNLDGDVSLNQDYYSSVLDRFRGDPSLGIAGGAIYEWDGTSYSPRRGNTVSDVAGAALVFRRRCFEDTNGYLPLKYGGEDWCAQISARMKGWRVASLPELHVYHHGIQMGPASFQRVFRRGRMDFFVGSHPLAEFLRVMRRGRYKPFGIGAIVRLSGFFSGYFLGQDRPVSDEIVQFLRREELGRIAKGFTRVTTAGDSNRTEPPIADRRSS